MHNVSWVELVRNQLIDIDSRSLRIRSKAISLLSNQTTKSILTIP
jgi:hypothetical protein